MSETSSWLPPSFVGARVVDSTFQALGAAGRRSWPCGWGLGRRFLASRQQYRGHLFQTLCQYCSFQGEGILLSSPSLLPKPLSSSKGFRVCRIQMFLCSATEASDSLATQDRSVFVCLFLNYLYFLDSDSQKSRRKGVLSRKRGKETPAELLHHS